MNYMLDTDTFSFLARGVSSIQQAALKIGLSQMCISVVTQAEVLYGLRVRSVGARRTAVLMELFEAIEILPLTSDVASRYGQLRGKLEKQGLPIGPNDFWIASHALATGLTLVTNNTREFSRVPKLALDNWIKRP